MISKTINSTYWKYFQKLFLWSKYHVCYKHSTDFHYSKRNFLSYHDWLEFWKVSAGVMKTDWPHNQRTTIGSMLPCTMLSKNKCLIFLSRPFNVLSAQRGKQLHARYLRLPITPRSPLLQSELDIPVAIQLGTVVNGCFSARVALSRLSSIEFYIHSVPKF